MSCTGTVYRILRKDKGQVGLYIEVRAKRDQWTGMLQTKHKPFNDGVVSGVGADYEARARPPTHSRVNSKRFLSDLVPLRGQVNQN